LQSLRLAKHSFAGTTTPLFTAQGFSDDQSPQINYSVCSSDLILEFIILTFLLSFFCRQVTNIDF
jgi:hypothetical protein